MIKPEGANIIKKIGENPFARAALLSAALHAPLVPHIGRAMFGKELDASYEAKLQEILERWTGKGAVLHPQSSKEKKHVLEKINARKSHADLKAAETVKRDMRERIQLGEPLKFRDVYFELERVNGVDPKLVEQGKQRAESLIIKFSQEAHGELSEPLIKRIVGEMYGLGEYDWGQASVSRYFVDGSHNCVSIGKGELIVFEGVVDSLPEPARQRYALGLRKVAQHEIATLGMRQQPNGPVGRTFLLEPPVQVEHPDAAERSGTANVGLDLLKRSMVADRPVMVSAEASKKGEAVPDSPVIDMISDQPVFDGVLVQGKLRGSEYVRQEAIREGIVPEVSQQAQVTEFDILTEESERETFLKRWGMNRTFGVLDLRDLKEPVAKTLEMHPDTGPWPRDTNLPDVSKWSVDAIKAAFMMGASELHIQTEQGVGTRFNETAHIPPGVFTALQSLVGKDPGPMGFKQLHFHNLDIQTPLQNTEPVSRFTRYAHVPVEELKKLLEEIVSTPGGNLKGIRLPYGDLTKEEIHTLATSGVKRVYLPHMWSTNFTDPKNPLGKFDELLTSDIVFFLKGVDTPAFESMRNFLPDIEHMNEYELQTSCTQLFKLAQALASDDRTKLGTFPPRLLMRKDDVEASYKAAKDQLRVVQARNRGEVTTSTGDWSSYVSKFQKRLQRKK